MSADAPSAGSDPERPRDAHALRATAIAAMGAATLSLVTLARLALWPYPLENFEGGCVWAARLWTAGQPLYVEPHGPLLPIFNYPPLYAGILRLADSAAHPFLAGRLVSLAAVIAIAVLAAMLARRSANARAVWIAAAVFLIVPETARLGALVRVDALASALSLAALVVGAVESPSRRRLALAALLGVAAWMTKQTAIAGPLALGLWWVVCERRRALVFGAMYAAGLGVAIAACEWASGVFLQNILGFSVTPFAWGRLAYYAGGYIRLDTAPHLLALAGFALALAARTEDGRVAPLAIYAAVTAASLVALGKEGSSHLYMFEFHAACAAGVAVGLDRARGGGASRGAMVAAAAFALLLIASIPSVSPTRNVPASDAADRMLVEALRARPGPAILENSGYALVAGTDAPDLVNPYLAHKLFARGLFDERPWLERVRDRRYALIVLESPPSAPSVVTRERFSDEFLRAVAENYAPAGRAGAYVVCVPREN
ncbi:MAG: glycosyltransferase family 39 protein [Deltaproteobacteria bacterium]|nr:glycosyltransferase family 39 protein [Deltaproteobacteria bacterium]